MCELIVSVDDYFRHYSIFHFYNHDISLCLMQVLKRKFLEIAGAIRRVITEINGTRS